MIRRRPPIPLLLGALALGILDVASGDSANGNGTAPAPPPSVFIDAPEDRSMVREASFEITGGLGGSVIDIEVFLDGTSLGPARRGEEAGRWRLPANDVLVTPGLHRLSAVASGDAGTASAAAWIFFDTDLPFEVAVEPPAASFAVGDLPATYDDPDLLLFGNGVQLNMTVVAPEGIQATTNDRLSTGSIASLDVRSIDTETPGTYPITVRGTADDGTFREATHTITITGSPSAGPPPGATLFDDFEGADLWTSTVTASPNGSEATAELAPGGNPGTLRRMAHVLPGTDDGEANPTQITVVHLYEGGGWDPATDGAVASIIYSEDYIEIDPPFDGAAVGTLFVVEQDGTTYTAPVLDGNAFSNTEWATATRTFTSADFPGIDFSASGGPLRFGYLRSNTSRSATDITVTHGIDNWTIEIVPS